MADVFISYSRADRSGVEKLAEALGAAGISVWWDKEIEGGAEFSKETEARLNEAKAVVVVWSKHSVQSTWVADEATVGRDKGILVPVLLDGAPPKIGFRQFQTIDFANWHGDAAASEFLALQRALAMRIGTAPAAPSAQQPWTDRLREPRVLALLAAVILAFVAAAMLAPRLTKPDGAATTAQGENANAAAQKGVGLAVLPFASLSNDPDQEHFADGLTEELLNWLANVEGLEVPGRTSSFQFKGKAGDLRAIGDALSVDYLLEGSVRRSGEKLRITAQLIESKSGNHLWSETYDRTLTDIFAIQDDIARIVVTELLGKIPQSGAANPAAVGDVDPKAHQLYLEGRAIWATGGYASLKFAFEKFEAATRLDPRHAFAHAYLAVVAADALAAGDSFAGFEQNREAIVAQALAEAVRLKPEAADVLFAQGWVAQMRSSGRRGSAISDPAILDFYERAVRANPRHIEALSMLAGAEPSPQKAVALYERILKIDPADSGTRLGLYYKLVETGELAKAGAIARQSLIVSPGPLTRAMPASAGITLGDMALVGEALFAEWDVEDRVSEPAWLRASMLASLGAVDEARFLYSRAAAADHPPWNQRGLFFVALLDEDAAAALRIAQEINQRDPPPADSALMLARALIRLGEPERAYEVLLARWPDLLKPKIDDRRDLLIVEFLTAAQALALSGRRTEAQRLWRAELAAIEREPAAIWSDYLSRALLYGNLGDQAAAISNFEAAYDAGFRYLRSGGSCNVCVDDGFYAASGLFAELVKTPDIAAIMQKIEAENAMTLGEFNRKYGVLDKVRAMMAEDAAN